MKQHTLQNKERFNKLAGGIYARLFGGLIGTDYGVLELRAFPPNIRPQQYFCTTISMAVDMAYEICNSGKVDCWSSVNLRVGKAGWKDDIHYLVAFQAEANCEENGHKSYDEVLQGITNFQIKPTILIHTGEGFNCYWILTTPIKLKNNVDIATMETINKNLSLEIGGDAVAHDITKFFRVPGTYNFNDPANPREVTCLFDDGPTYAFEDFSDYTNIEQESVRETDVGEINVQISSPNSSVTFLQPNI